MPRPWTRIETADTPEGPLELRRRGEQEFMILHAGRVLMTSAYHRSEVAVAELGCEPIKGLPRPQVLVGGAGLGFTLRAVLDAMPEEASVTVAELNPVVLRWCQGPLAVLTNDAMGDRRTTVFAGDVMDAVRTRTGGAPSPGHRKVDAAGKGPKTELGGRRKAGQGGPNGERGRGKGPAKSAPRTGWDAIVVDLYVGPENTSAVAHHPLYGDRAIADVYASLNSGGCYAVWGEEGSRSFERRLQRAGFGTRVERTHGPGPHHVIFLAEKP